MIGHMLKSAAAIGCSIATGCTTTWQDHYDGAPAGVYEPTGSVSIREVPWSRVDDTLRRIEAERARSDVHRDEWTDEQRLAEQGVLLTGLQISEDPRDIIVLGRSVFRSTDHLSPDDGSLGRFAAEIGADYAIWSAHYLGTREVVEHEPVHTWGSASGGPHGRHGRYRSDDRSWSRTVYVPVVVEADEYAWVVYCLRRR
ncbi:MAG: hypothetical protein AAGA55_03800 [Planctomycetota bacterium]